MAYNVSEKFRKQCYSGVSMFIAKLTINGKLVPYSQIKSIKISSPIIDTTSQTFYIGSFISQQITITFKNLDGLDIKSGNEVSLDIGQLIDGTFEWCPIGKYLIEEPEENYYQTCQIVCLDYGVKFKKNVDYTPYMTNIAQDGEEPLYEIEVDDLVRAICEICEVELGSMPSTNGNKKIYSYDNTKSGKEYISYLAELKGCNVKIDRYGKLILVPLQKQSTISINAIKSKTWTLGEKFKITHIAYFDGVPTLHSFPEDENIVEENKVIIRQNNPFILGVNNEDTKERVENIYNVVKDFEMWSVKNENYGDISMDAWDIIEFTLGDEIYYTLNDNEITFEQNIMTKIEPKLTTKNQEINVNIYEDGSLEGTVRKITQALLDPINQKIIYTIEKVDDHESRLVKVEYNLDGLQIKVNDHDQKITDFQVGLDGVKLDMTKTGNNLLRNTMFYDFEGWSTLNPIFIIESDTAPTDGYATYWYCTRTYDNYENSIVYVLVYDENDNITWQKTDIKYSEMSKNFSPSNEYSIISNENTRQKYISGRALNIKSDNFIKPIGGLFGDKFDILDSENEMTLSFKLNGNLKNGGSFYLTLWFYEDLSGSQFYTSQPFYSITVDTFENNISLNNKLFKEKVILPRSINAISVIKSDTAPIDTSVYWLKMTQYDYGRVNIYNEETQKWEEQALQTIIKDQDNKLYYSSYSKIYNNYNDFIEITNFYPLKYGNTETYKNTFTPRIGYPFLGIIGGQLNSLVNVELGDIKLEYGNYSEWSPKNTEVMGTNHLLDETGYKIMSGDDTMRLMIDELAQYYKDNKTFYINKTEVFSQNARSITSDVDGLNTSSFSANNNKIYGRYII